ncbi:putative prophage tail protein [Klebsiella variicola]|nr:putative prophage tail protein [Klebsiella variicola]
MLDMMNLNAGGVLTPDFMLMLESKDITGNVSNRLMSLTMTDNRDLRPTSLISSSMTPTGLSSCRYVVPC